MTGPPMSAPTPARSEMVEKVLEVIRQHTAFRSAFVDEHFADSLIAAVLDNLPHSALYRNGDKLTPRCRGRASRGARP